MNETDYNARLYEKMKAEQNKYRDRLLHKEPSEILNHTYEYTMREDIAMCIDIYAKVKYNKPWELAPVINQVFSINSEKESA